MRIGRGQVTEVLGTWNRTTTSQRQWLSIDRNGEMLLSVARDSTAQTKVFRIDNPNVIGSGTPTIAGIMTLPVAVKFQPMIDPQAYWFLGENASDQTPNVQQPARLVLATASWADVGAAF